MRFKIKDIGEKLSWDCLDESYLNDAVRIAIEEDLRGRGLNNINRKLSFSKDLSSCSIPKSLIGKASFIARESLIVCGIKLIPIILKNYDLNLKFKSKTNDGNLLKSNSEIGVIEGPVRSILTAERIVLNFLQHLSGISTNTNKYIKCLNGSKTKLLDTRKTTPGFRALEKYAFSCGGGYNHRYGLFDRIMIKDNHLAALNTDYLELKKLRHEFPSIPIHVEVDSLTQIEVALELGADCILLDNFSLSEIKKDIILIKNKAFTEASGGIKIDFLKKINNIGLDFISSGAPIYESKWIDIGLDWKL